MKLSHLDAAGRARMVDVGDKAITVRTATAEGAIRMSPEAYRRVAEQAVVKGDVLAVSEVAGTMAAKRTAELIPLCHPVGLDHVEVEATLDETLPGVRLRAAAKAVGRTGVEMEALTAVSVARSEEHTSELQSQSNLVCRLLLEKKSWQEPSGSSKATSKRHRSRPCP